ncbi:unnamed protein product [Microthlaspi erraticum]|uniref:Uncharacterized protein n=1 Tax=Microthlaspi erraticum TaxID=1685480 RepID=A0A6D2JW16_9BRAS|nr:unnamed protein product [Microthlaspi erraticum]
MEMDLNKALQSMTIEGDRPFKLPIHQRYCSTERNKMSIMGKMLNPENQNMKSLIWDLPRAFNCFDRVHGVALTKDSFQFFFKYEEDLKKVPVNYYTEATITDIAEVIGQVIEVAFDPEKPQSQRYVRARVLFDTSKPLRNFKTVELPEGDVVTVTFEYERIRKRCFQCLRLTHDKSRCPENPARRSNLVAKPAPAKAIVPAAIVVQTPRLLPDDPLFGVLTQASGR